MTFSIWFPSLLCIICLICVVVCIAISFSISNKSDKRNEAFDDFLKMFIIDYIMEQYRKYDDSDKFVRYMKECDFKNSLESMSTQTLVKLYKSFNDSNFDKKKIINDVYDGTFEIILNYPKKKNGTFVFWKHYKK